MITQDFGLPTNSRVHGSFIADCYDLYSDGIVTSATFFHKTKTGFTLLTFTCPEDAAVWLKLKYGDYLITASI